MGRIIKRPLCSSCSYSSNDWGKPWERVLTNLVFCFCSSCIVEVCQRDLNVSDTSNGHENPLASIVLTSGTCANRYTWNEVKRRQNSKGDCYHSRKTCHLCIVYNVIVCPRLAHFSGLNTRRHLVCISCNKEACDDYSQDVILKTIVNCGLSLVSQLRKKQLDSKHHLIQVEQPQQSKPLWLIPWRKMNRGNLPHTL